MASVAHHFPWKKPHRNYRYQQHFHVTAVDLDSKCVHMAYLQVSLLHVPAVLILGNSLSLEERALGSPLPTSLAAGAQGSESALRQARLWNLLFQHVNSSEITSQ